MIGQPGFTSGTSSPTSTGLDGPFFVAFDHSGNLWVSDEWNNRILEYLAPFTDGEAASLVIGQSGFATNASATTSTGLYAPIGITFDSHGNLWVVDSGNDRILEYLAPFTDGEAASVVLGQSSFTTNSPAYPNPTRSGLFDPFGIAFDPSGNLWVADNGNSRVLEFPLGTGFTNGEAASVVIGQNSFTAKAIATTSTGLFYPIGVAFDSHGNLWVADYGNSRVLEYLLGTGFTTGEAASLVIGQDSFSAGNSATTSTGLSYEYGIAFDPSGNLWVADSGNSRVLEFPLGAGFTNGEAASVVIGQNSFTTSSPATTATGLNYPFGIASDASGNIWVSDESSNRVLEYAGSSTSTTTTTSVSCVPSAVAPGSSTTCKATVSGSLPSGTVTFSTSSSTGSFTPSNGLCTLSSGSCSVTYTDTEKGAATIKGTYSGDSNNLPSSGTFLLTINGLSVTCQDSSIPLSYYGTYTICTATVAGSSPSGEVSWSSSAGGWFSQPPTLSSPLSSECTLSAGSCSVPFTPSYVSYEFSPVTITASYAGDTNNAPSSGTFSITITWVPGCYGSIAWEYQGSSVLCLSDPPGNFVITTPSGGQAGCDASGNIVNAIGASATVSGCSPQETIAISNAAAGQYKVQIYGTATGTVTVTIVTFDSSGNQLATETFGASVTPGSSPSPTLLNVAADGKITILGSSLGVPEFPLSLIVAVVAILFASLNFVRNVRRPHSQG